MRGVVVFDGSVPAGHEVVHGPGRPDSRACANPDCDRTIRVEDARSKQYCEPRCRTAAWKARKSSQAASGVVAVRAFGPPTGDAQNARDGLSKRAQELRVARAQGTVASDLRVQYSRAVDVLEDYLRLLNVSSPARVAHELMAKALPKGRRG